MAGTWTNAQGLVSDDMDLYANGVANGIANFTYAPRSYYVGSAALAMIPAGTPAVGGAVYSQDVIIIGQSVSAEEAPC